MVIYGGGKFYVSNFYNKMNKVPSKILHIKIKNCVIKRFNSFIGKSKYL